VIYRGKVPSTLLLLASAILYASAVTASASTLTVSVSGQFGSGVIADQLAASDGTWALSFDVDSIAAATNTDMFSFDAPFSDFSYLLNGSAVAVSPQSIRFFDSGDGGLFTVFFGPETGFFNGMPIPEFSFSGDQVFSGTPGNPTILPGSYSVGDALYSDALNYDDEGAFGTVTITGTQSAVPEPSIFWLLFTFTVMMFLARLYRRRIRLAPIVPETRRSSATMIAIYSSDLGSALARTCSPEPHSRSYFLRASHSWPILMSRNARLLRCSI
jgi:hypothetical protein